MHVGPAPDIETSTEGYARRFSGGVGRYFLQTQEQTIQKLLIKSADSAPLSILELGGGHLQLAPGLAQAGYRVVVHSSSLACLASRLVKDAEANPLRFVVGSLKQLPFPPRSFDIVIAVRLVAHVEDWQTLLGVMSSLARRQVIIDYAPLSSFNLLTPLLFPLKQKIEKYTRPYYCHWGSDLRKEFKKLGFANVVERKQFFLPMGIHRALSWAKFSEISEGLAERVGLTSRFGSPSILSALRSP